MSKKNEKIIFAISTSNEKSKNKKKKRKEKFVVIRDAKIKDNHFIREDKNKNEKELHEDNFSIILDSIGNNSFESNQELIENIYEGDKKNQEKMNSPQSKNNNNIVDEISQCKFIYIFYFFIFS